MIKQTLIALLLSCVTLFAYSQSLIQGTILNAEKKPVDGAVVSVIANQTTMIGYGIADDAGKYKIKIKPDVSPLHLTVSAMGYESAKTAIDNESQTKDITLKTKVFELREVTVKSDRIWKRNDTLVYSVDAFKSTQDRTIADLLKKLPGIEVSESGAVKYQGESINKFYIEGMDLMQTKYGLVTNNLPVNAVQNVEVIENHQPVKALSETVFSEKAAINLKLKGGKMERPVGSIIAGTGADENDWLWLLNIFGMQANKTNQTMAMYKTNNAGVDISKEMNNLYFEDMYGAGMSDLTDKSFFNENTLRGMQLEDKRYLFNQSHLLTVNHLRKINKDRTFRLNANYLNDERQETVEQTFSYYSATSPLYIEEISTPVKTNNQGNIALTYSENSDRFYLNNKLDGTLKGDKLRSPIFADTNVDQRYDLPEYKIGNDLQLVKRIGNRTWNILSRIDYTYKPQELTVINDLYPEAQTQEVTYKGLYADLQTSYGITHRKSSFRLGAKIMYLNEDLNTDLRSSVFTDSVTNKLSGDQLQFSVLPRYQWRDRKTTLVIEANMAQNVLSIDNKQRQSNKKLSPFILSPKVNLNRKLNLYWEGSFVYSYTRQLGDILNFMPGYIQYDYRTYGIKSDVLSERERHLASLKLNYKDILNAVFFNTSLSYTNANRNLLNKTLFNNTATINTTIEQDNRSSNWMWSGYVGKHLNSIGSNLSLSTNVSFSKSEKIQQEDLYPIHNTGYNAQMNWTTRFNDALQATYTGAFGYNILRIDTPNGNTENSNHQLSQKLIGNYSAGKHWAFGLQGEHLFAKLSDNNEKSLFFGDLSVKYLHRDFDLLLTWNNLFNQKQYKTIVYNELNVYTYNYKLRPSNLMLSLVYKY